MADFSRQALIVIAGCPFTGKTSVGDILREVLGFPFLAVDRFRPLIFGKTKTYAEDPDGDFFQLARSYPVMFASAEALLKLGESVIIEGTFSKKIYQEEIGRILKKFSGIIFKMLVFDIPEEKADEILRGRALMRLSRGSSSGATLPEDYWRVKKICDPIIYPHLKIDTSRLIEENVSIILDYISKDSGPLK